MNRPGQLVMAGLVSALIVVATGCGSEPPPAGEPEPGCQEACEHVQGEPDEGGCDQNFRYGDGSAMNLEECVEACEEDNLMAGREACIGEIDECLDEPADYVAACEPEDPENVTDPGPEPTDPECSDNQIWDAEVAEKEARVLELVNQYRAQGADCGAEGEFGPADPLEMNAHLRCAARLHSVDMVERDFFAHENPDGQGPAERVAETDFEGAGAIGENIFQGPDSAEQAVEGWMSSDGHCANIMRPEFNYIGVGLYERHWTQKFAM